MSPGVDGNTPRAVVLLSGGLDSATCLAIAHADGFACHALNIAYGQRHDRELAAAERVAQSQQVAEFRRIRVDLAGIGGSALTDPNIAVPDQPSEGIPATYVPARNTTFLSIALGWAEVLGARDIFIGVNAVDYSGYPDCRPAFIEAFESLARLATRAGVEQGAAFKIHTPLIELSKAEIIRRGQALAVDYAQTVSCYRPNADGYACGNCDACRFRQRGFEEAGVPDPTHYASKTGKT